MDDAPIVHKISAPPGPAAELVMRAVSVIDGEPMVVSIFTRDVPDIQVSFTASRANTKQWQLMERMAAAVREPDASARWAGAPRIESGEPAGGSGSGLGPEAADEVASASLLREADVIFDRVREGIAAQNTAMDALLARLARHAG